ncbi:MOSC domain-containing protein [Phreatobacter sp. AB_2022a]|uniref:MOSC domain-containing protein n=1 Tax=Phreatobacter sp. AB_2022a TaxID=3003134 RepID=UPI002286E4DB|nr:MOSC domain-containing protein [Phreatobacter sp. AB_2022a]MCZ0733937.1 MOSC domain-containing protein [Phreatobacter sp. AB_2022a]
MTGRHDQGAPAWRGVVAALHTAPRSFLPMRSMQQLDLIEGLGVKGDRYANQEGFYSDRPEAGRQVTLFEAETLEALQRDHKVLLSADDHRRNVTTRGVPLNHLVGARFRVGDVVLEGTRLSTPCRHIEQITGLEIFNLLLNRSGLHARIVSGGTIRVGDTLRPEA